MASFHVLNFKEKWFIFLIGPLYLIGMWFNEDQRANIIKTHVSRNSTTSYK